MKFMETSAKLNINIENAFITLAKDIKSKMEKRQVILFLIIFVQKKTIILF